MARPVPSDVLVPADGVDLPGILVEPRGRDSFVLFAHGSGSSRFSPRNNYVAGVLQRAGIGTLLMDLLTAGEDHNPATRFDIGLLTERLVAATRWLATRRPAASIGYFGASTGAAAALCAAARLRSEIGAVVSRGGRPDLAGEDVLGQVTAPTLLLVGERDPTVVRLNYESYDRLQCEKEMTIIPGATHLFEEAGALDTVAGLASEWFERHLARVASTDSRRADRTG